MKKKFYESPLAVEVKIEAEHMLATSFQINGDDVRVDTDGDDDTGGQLSAGHRGEWGNLWKK